MTCRCRCHVGLGLDELGGARAPCLVLLRVSLYEALNSGQQNYPGQPSLLFAFHGWWL